MIRVDTDGVMQYKLVEDTQVTRIETRTIAARLSREDADQIAGLLNVANGKVEQAEINRKLDEIALADQERRNASLRMAGFIPPGLQTPAPFPGEKGWTSVRINGQPIKPVETPTPDGWVPSTRYPGTFENQAGVPCLCFHCKTGRKVADAVPQYSIRPMTGSNVLWQLYCGDLIIAGDMTRKNAEFILSKVKGDS